MITTWYISFSSPITAVFAVFLLYPKAGSRSKFQDSKKREIVFSNNSPALCLFNLLQLQLSYLLQYISASIHTRSEAELLPVLQPLPSDRSWYPLWKKFQEEVL